MVSPIFTIKIFAVLSLVLIAETLQIDNGDEFESYGCDADRKLPDQPDIVGFPVIKKCCRDNENLRIANITVESFSCHRHDYPIYVNYSIVELYEDCIWFRNRSGGEIELQSVEKPPNHEYFPCMYYGDVFGSHIIQNGSLLVVKTYGAFMYRLNNDYCLDADAYTGAYMVCHYVNETSLATTQELKIDRHANIIQKFFTIISIPCFIGIGLLYIFIKEFRNLHGVCVISMACFLTVEFVLRSVFNNMKGNEAIPLGHTVQYFDLANHFWMLVLFTNTMLFLWIYLPYKHIEWRPFGICSYGMFFVACMVLPTIVSSRLEEDEIITMIDFLTTPKTTIVLVCILLIIIIFVGANRLTALIRNEIFQKYIENSIIDDHEIEMRGHHYQLEDVQTRLTCLTSLIGLMVIMRIFHIPGHRHLVILRETLKSLQGIVFVLIFIVLRYKEIRNFVWRRLKK